MKIPLTPVARAHAAAPKAHTWGMGNSWVSTVGYPLLFCTPWLAGIAWMLRRTPAGDGTPQPSLGERARMNLG